MYSAALDFILNAVLIRYYRFHSNFATFSKDLFVTFMLRSLLHFVHSVIQLQGWYEVRDRIQAVISMPVTFGT
jgi:hypothetical protein